MVSLIVATVGRVEELERLLASLEQQSYRHFEVIVVDQNPDERLAPALSRHPRLAIVHLRSGRGLSRARNVGLRIARGTLVAIPDDDCWYPPDLLGRVVEWFASDPRFGLLGVSVRTAEGSPSGPNSPARPRECAKRNIWGCGVSTALFLRAQVCRDVGEFDENIGVGSASAFQSGEETDYILRAFAHGFRMWFEPALTVHHPALDSPARLLRTTYPFALGSGRILRIHHYPLHLVGAQLIRSCGGAVLSLCHVDFLRARVYLLRALGQLVGYVGSAPKGAERQTGAISR
jgi:GT2 family glycosyltransferase